MTRARLRSIVASTFVALAGWAAGASAQMDPGPYLKWGLPHGEGGVVDRAFACDVNTGDDELVGTFVLPFDVPGVVGIDARLTVVHTEFLGISDPFGQPPPVFPVVVPWWRFQPGGCRAGGFSVNADFAFEPFASSATYEDFLQGRAFTLGQAEWPVGADSTRVQLHAIALMPDDQATDLTAGHAYYAFRLRLRHTRATGATVCEGCCVKSAISIRDLRLLRPVGVGDVILSPQSFDAVVSWQFGNATCGIVPARPSTWGSLKTRYR